MKYVRSIPGRDGVPFKYIIIDKKFANLTPNKSFLDDYVNNASLQGESFIIDTAEVHTFIFKPYCSERRIRISYQDTQRRKKWKKGLENSNIPP